MAHMPALPANPTLQDLQFWVREMKAANNWTPSDFRHEAALLMEEVGELMKAHRKSRAGSYLTATQREDQDTVGEEIADVLIYTLSLANVAGVDAAAALATKLEKNRQREWQQNAASQA